VSGFKWEYSKNKKKYTVETKHNSLLIHKTMGNKYSLIIDMYWIGKFKRLKDAKQVAELIARG